MCSLMTLGFAAKNVKNRLQNEKSSNIETNTHCIEAAIS